MFADMLLPGVQAQTVALATLLIEKGVITLEEWETAVADTAKTLASPEYHDALMNKALGKSHT